MTRIAQRSTAGMAQIMNLAIRSHRPQMNHGSEADS
jgi:hypothetical protein